MMGGLAYMTGPPGRPLRAGTSVIDVTGGMFGVIAVLAAIEQRHTTGRGQKVSSALFETTVYLVGQHMAQMAVTGRAALPMPVRISAWAIYDVFETRDNDHVFVGIVSDGLWQKFCDNFYLAELGADPRYKANNDRVAAREVLLPQVRDLKIDLNFDLNVNQSIPLNSNEISQVIINLLNNSIEALSNSNQSNKEIQIHTRIFGNYVELKISDNGPGVPDHLKASIFELMKTNKKQGMGLGLWLCKHIVERHQGRISYQQSPLGGAEFLIQLPIECVHA
jgi:hypothetical protein